MMSRPRLIKARKKLFFFGVATIFLLGGIYLTLLHQKNRITLRPCSDSVKCAEVRLLTKLKSKGVDAAFDELEKLYNSDKNVAFNCHYFTHLIGSQAYFKYKNHENFTLTPKTSYCGYGFYHGFMETLLKDNNDIEEARRFCFFADKSLSEYTKKPSVACFHGIGHGAVDGTEPRAWGNPQLLLAPALQICSRLKSNKEKYLCASGAFNSLAIAYNTKKFGLKLNKSNPYKDCPLQTESDFMHACYEEMNTTALEASNGSLSNALAFAQKIPSDTYADIAAENVAAAYAQMMKSPSDYDIATSICQKTQSRLIKSCIYGIEGGLLEFGAPGKEYKTAVAFCGSSKLTNQNKMYCYSRLSTSITQLYPKDMIKPICATFPLGYKYLCAI